MDFQSGAEPGDASAAPTPGVRVDYDPHVLGLGVELEDKILTVALPREWLPLLRLEFATRPAEKIQ